MDVWKDLEPLRRNKHVGVELTLFGVLWELCDGEPREIVVTTKRLAREFNRDAASLRDQLVKLYRLGIIDLVDRDKRRGVFRMIIYRPLPAHAIKKPDPQKVLPGFWSDGDPETPSAAADLKPAEPKTPMPESAFLASEQGLRPLTGEGFFSADCAGKSPRDGEIPAPAEGRKGAGKSPRDTAADRENAAKTPIPSLPSGADQPRGDFPARNRASRARASNESAKRASLLNGLNEQHGPNEFKELNEFKETFRPGKSPRDGEIPAPAGGASFGPRAIGETICALAFAVAQAAAPTAAKLRLVADLRQLVADPNTGDWLYGFAADLMLIYGRSQHPYAARIHDAIHDLVQELRNLREVEKRKGLKPSPRGMRLNKIVHQTAEKFGIRTPKQQAQRTAASAAYQPGEERQ